MLCPPVNPCLIFFPAASIDRRIFNFLFYFFFLLFCHDSFFCRCEKEHYAPLGDIICDSWNCALSAFGAIIKRRGLELPEGLGKCEVGIKSFILPFSNGLVEQNRSGYMRNLVELKINFELFLLLHGLAVFFRVAQLHTAINSVNPETARKRT